MQYFLIITALVGFLAWAALRLRRTRRPATPAASTPSADESQWDLSAARTFSAPVDSHQNHSSIEEALNPKPAVSHLGPAHITTERPVDSGSGAGCGPVVPPVTRPLPASTVGGSTLAGHGVFSPAAPRRHAALTGSQQVVGNSEQIATSVASHSAGGASVSESADDVVSTGTSPRRASDSTPASAAVSGTQTAQLRIADVTAVPGRRVAQNGTDIASRAEVDALNAAVAEHTSSFTDTSPSSDLPETGTGTSPMSCPIPVVPLSTPPKATMRRLPSSVRPGTSKLSVPTMRPVAQPTVSGGPLDVPAARAPQSSWSTTPAVVPAPAPTLEPLAGFDVLDEPTDATAPTSLPSLSAPIPAAVPRVSSAGTKRHQSVGVVEQAVSQSPAGSVPMSSGAGVVESSSRGVPKPTSSQGSPVADRVASSISVSGAGQSVPQLRATVAPLAASSAPVVPGAVFTAPSRAASPAAPTPAGDQAADSAPSSGDRVFAAPMTQSLPLTVQSTFFGHTAAPEATSPGAQSAAGGSISGTPAEVNGGASQSTSSGSGSSGPASAGSRSAGPGHSEHNLIDLTELEQQAGSTQQS